MNLLAFDTSTDVMSIAVQRGAGGLPEIWRHTGAGGAQASTALIPAILQLMQQAGLRFDELDSVAFGCGPGSFTGLRTACSVAQGLAFGAGVPVLPVDTLLAVAEEARYQWCAVRGLRGLHSLGDPQEMPGICGTGDTPDTDIPAQAPHAQAPHAQALHAQATSDQFQVLALLDARMDEVYAAGYEWKGECAGECTGERNGDKFVQRMGLSLIRPDDLVLQPGWHLAGNAVQAYGSRVPGDSPWHIHALPTAHALLRLAPALLAAGMAVPANQALPVYIRDKVAKTTLEREQDKLKDKLKDKLQRVAA